MATPEAFSRHKIDAQLVANGRVIQNRLQIILYTIQDFCSLRISIGIRLLRFLAFHRSEIDQKAMGVIEATAEG